MSGSDSGSDGRSAFKLTRAPTEEGEEGNFTPLSVRTGGGGADMEEGEEEAFEDWDDFPVRSTPCHARLRSPAAYLN